MKLVENKTSSFMTKKFTLELTGKELLILRAGLWNITADEVKEHFDSYTTQSITRPVANESFQSVLGDLDNMADELEVGKE